MEKVANTKAAVKSQTNEQAAVKPQVQANEHAAAVDAEKLAKFKEQKKAAAKAWKERKDKEAADRVESAKKLIEFLDSKKVELPAELASFLSGIANPTIRSNGGSGNSLFNKIFGDSPKVGDSVTLMDYMKKTLKSKADLDRYCKIWAEKGTVLEFKPAANMLESTYTIKALA